MTDIEINEEDSLIEVLKNPSPTYRQTHYSPGNIELFQQLKKVFVENPKRINDILISKRYDYHNWLSSLVSVIKTIYLIQGINKVDNFTDIRNKVSENFDFDNPIYKDSLYFLYDKNRVVGSLEIPIVTYIIHSKEGKIRNLNIQLLNAGTGQLFPAKEIAFIEVEQDWIEAFNLVFYEIKSRYPNLDKYDIRWYVSQQGCSMLIEQFKIRY